MNPDAPADAADLPARPSNPVLLWRGSTMACPLCGRRRLFRRWMFMEEDCPRCGLHFERVEGHWIGALAVSTVLTFGLLILALALFFTLAFPETKVGLWILPAAVAFGAVPLVLYPMAKTLWTALDLMMRPLEPGEARPKSEWT